MHRRQFSVGLATGLVGSVFPWRLRQEALRVSGDRLNARLTDLARYGRTSDGGISRVAYSKADLDARLFVRGLLRDAGLNVSVDLAGNLIGHKAGLEPDLLPLVIGSHIDSVPDGGNYDGQVGSMGAVEVARTLHDVSMDLRHPLTVVIFQNEEGGKTGSRAWSGEVEQRELDIVTASGKTIGEGIRFLGGDPDRLDDAAKEPGAFAGYLELHIEQGAILDQRSIDIGVVEGIVGIKRWNVVVTGMANHAGTTPMSDRRDAMVGAGSFITAVNRIARRLPGRQVATVGRLEAFPGAPNVIPGEVRLSLEVRDLTMEGIDRFYEAVRVETHVIEQQTETTFTFDQFYVSRAAPTDERFRALVDQSAQALELSTLHMPSGAGHDAQSIALLCPVGMVFVPSVNGVSHSPEEYTRPEDVANGANVLLGTLLQLDETLD